MQFSNKNFYLSISADNQTWHYYINGYHRLKGAAVIQDGGFQWHKKGKLHRIDGPAVIYSNKEYEYFIYGHLVYRQNTIEHITMLQNIV